MKREWANNLFYLKLLHASSIWPLKNKLLTDEKKHRSDSQRLFKWNTTY